MQCLFVKCHICFISAQLSCVFTALSGFFEMDGGTPMTNIYLRHEWSVQTASSGFIPKQSQLTLISVPLRKVAEWEESGALNEKCTQESHLVTGNWVKPSFFTLHLAWRYPGSPVLLTCSIRFYFFGKRLVCVWQSQTVESFFSDQS